MMLEPVMLFKKLNGKTFTIIAAFVCLVIGLYFFGCDSKTTSLLDPTKTVTRAELTAEFEIYKARAMDRFASLDRQDAIKKFVTEQASVVATGGAINPVGAINSLISIFAIGYAVDARRKIKSVDKT
jgi:hypothetical protein